MKPILCTPSVSFVESLRIALEAEDIAFVVTNKNSAGISTVAITVAVADDVDYERALAVLRGIEVTAPPPWFNIQRTLRLTVAVIIALALLVWGLSL